MANAWYLANTSDPALVLLDSEINDTASGVFRVVFGIEVTGTQYILTSSGASTELVFFSSLTNLQLRTLAGQYNITLDNPASGFHEYEIVGTGASLEVYQDGILQATVGNGTFFEIGVFLQFNNNSSRRGNFYYFQVYDSTDTIIHDYQPTLSGGTGSTLTDAESGNNGTLQNFPSGDSQWVLYSTGGGTGVTVNPTNVQTTGAVGQVSTTGAAVTPLTNVQTTGAVGDVSVGNSTSVALTGVQTTGAIGNVTIQTAQGAVVTGVQTTGAVGQVTTTGAAVALLTNVQTTGAVGDVSVGSGINVAVTGAQTTGAVGQVTVEAGQGAQLTGVASTGQIGDAIVTGNAQVNLLGLESEIVVGQVSAGEIVEVDVTGVQTIGAVGQVGVSVNTNVRVTGVSSQVGISGVNIWSQLLSNQEPDWQNINTTQNPNWRDIGI